jgi:hypothetical protein
METGIRTGVDAEKVVLHARPSLRSGILCRGR